MIVPMLIYFASLRMQQARPRESRHLAEDERAGSSSTALPLKAMSSQCAAATRAACFLKAVVPSITSAWPAKLTKTLWDRHGNRQIINRPLAASGDVQPAAFNKCWLWVICLPRAGRHERPIHKGQNALDGTFKRRHEGDYRCSPEEVRRMSGRRQRSACRRTGA